MASNVTTYWANKVQEILYLGTGAFPTVYYVSLYKGDPSTTGVEVSGGSYARVALTRGTTDFIVGVGAGSMKNKTVKAFPQSTASWSTEAAKITHYGIHDAATGGNRLMSGDVTTPRAIDIDSIYTLEAQGIELIMSN